MQTSVQCGFTNSRRCQKTPSVPPYGCFSVKYGCRLISYLLLDFGTLLLHGQTDTPPAASIQYTATGGL